MIISMYTVCVRLSLYKFTYLKVIENQYVDRGYSLRRDLFNFTHSTATLSYSREPADGWILVKANSTKEVS